MNSRANAAIVLGLAPDPADIALLEARLKRETDEQVKDSIRFALLCHGKKKYFKILLALTRKTKASRDHVLTMLRWLPWALKDTLDEALLADIAHDSDDYSTLSRVTAISILGDLAAVRIIEDESIIALLELTYDSDEEVAKAASQAAREFEQLTAAQCRSFYDEYSPASAALLHVLGKVASPKDLEFLKRAYTSSNTDNEDHINEKIANRDIQMTAAVAVANTQDKAGLQLLERWFIDLQDKDLLGLRGPLSRLLLELLASRDQTGRLKVIARHGSRDQLLVAKIISSRAQLSHTEYREIENMKWLEALHIVRVSAPLHRRDLVPTLWKLANHADSAAYPFDATLRWEAMSSIIEIEVRSLERMGSGH